MGGRAPLAANSGLWLGAAMLAGCSEAADQLHSVNPKERIEAIRSLARDYSEERAVLAAAWERLAATPKPPRDADHPPSQRAGPGDDGRVVGGHPGVGGVTGRLRGLCRFRGLGRRR